MRKNRIFIDQTLSLGTEVVLPEAAAHHVARVLRLRTGQSLILFNGQGGECDAEVSSIDKRSVSVKIKHHRVVEKESSLNITLVQGISRGQKMDFTLQKAVELGVNRIVPLLTEHGNVRLDEARLQKKIDHWRAIIIGACEQSGRNKIPELVVPLSFNAWLEAEIEHGAEATIIKLVLHPEADKGLSELSKPKAGVTLLVGPEGGLSDDEIKRACNADYQGLILGTRTLRTETAALAAISACQTLWGDFS